MDEETPDDAGANRELLSAGNSRGYAVSVPHDVHDFDIF